MLSGFSFRVIYDDIDRSAFSCDATHLHSSYCILFAAWEGYPDTTLDFYGTESMIVSAKTGFSNNVG